jgi:hypothetical protein
MKESKVFNGIRTHCGKGQQGEINNLKHSGKETTTPISMFTTDM